MEFSTLRSLPKRRRFVLNLGFLIMLSVYYVNYGAGFHEGTIETMGLSFIVLKVIAVAMIFGALAPRMQAHHIWLLVTLYGFYAVSYTLVMLIEGEYGDKLFLNTLIQIPVLVAIAQSRWKIDFPRLLHFIGLILAVQIGIDILILQNGSSLWVSQAYVGGAGNPSSFGIECVFMLAFYLLHPASDRRAFLMALLMFYGVVMTKSLFAALAAAVILFIWAIRRPWRLFLAIGAVVTMVLVVLSHLEGGDVDGDFVFLAHKISAAAAFVGVLDYSVESSHSVSTRGAMHEETFRALFDAPWRFMIGHFDGLTYWPMDSQFLTYLGSFGGVALISFLLLHILWIIYGYKLRKLDGGFCLIVFLIYSGIFLTNRILDYFPIASFYFFAIAIATRRGEYVKPVLCSPFASSQDSRR